MDFKPVVVPIAVGGVALAAQSPPLFFDVASVKSNVSKSFPIGPEAQGATRS